MFVHTSWTLLAVDAQYELFASCPCSCHTKGAQGTHGGRLGGRGDQGASPVGRDSRPNLTIVISQLVF